MALLDYNEIVPKKCIVYQGEPYEVVESHVARMQQRKPQNQTKIRNLLSGRVIPISFHSSERVEEADIENKDVKYLYTRKDEVWFCNPKDPSDRFAINIELLNGKEGFLKTNSIVSAMLFDEKIIGVRLPIKVDLMVKEAPPAVKGNTVQGGTNTITLETGARINVPMFINEGDVIRINTETGSYTERVDKNS